MNQLMIENGIFCGSIFLALKTERFGILLKETQQTNKGKKTGGSNNTPLLKICINSLVTSLCGIDCIKCVEKKEHL